MIVGIGNDIIEIDRIKKSISKDGFMEKFFTDKERVLFAQRHHNTGTIGGNFSVKESVSKALGTGFRDFGLKDIEVLRDALGKPEITLYNKAKELSDSLGISCWHVSISHSKTTIAAMVIGEKE